MDSLSTERSISLRFVDYDIRYLDDEPHVELPQVPNGYIDDDIFN